MRPLPILLLMLLCAAQAHQPWFNLGSPQRNKPYQIAQPQVSKVILAAANASRDWYALEVKAGFKLDLALFVAQNCPANLKPHFYVIGPGLEGPAPFELPAGTGAVDVAQTWSAYSGHGINARTSPRVERTLGAGRFEIVVEHGPGKGWYFLSLSGDEVFGGNAEGHAALERFNRCG